MTNGSTASVAQIGTVVLCITSELTGELIERKLEDV